MFGQRIVHATTFLTAITNVMQSRSFSFTSTTFRIGFFRFFYFVVTSSTRVVNICRLPVFGRDEWYEIWIYEAVRDRIYRLSRDLSSTGPEEHDSSLIMLGVSRFSLCPLINGKFIVFFSSVSLSYMRSVDKRRLCAGKKFYVSVGYRILDSVLNRLRLDGRGFWYFEYWSHCHKISRWLYFDLWNIVIDKTRFFFSKSNESEY